MNGKAVVIPGGKYRLEWSKRGVSPASGFIVSIGSVLLALLFSSVLIALNGLNPINVFETMGRGAFGSASGISETLVKAIPLLLCGLGVSFAYRISIWNIGAEGQFIAGAIATTAVTIYCPGMPHWTYLPLMFAAGAAAGGIWGLLAAVPRTHFQVNELISSLMLNYIALLLLDYFVYGPWKDPAGFNFPGTPMFETWMQLATLGSGRLHLGLFIGLGGVFFYWLILNRMRWGYELRLLGSNPEAARHAGISVTKQILLVMLISGGLAGAAGMAEVSGVSHRLMYSISPGYGYTAIIVAWLAKLNPWGLIVSSVLCGAVIVGGYSVQMIGLPASMSLIVQGAILLFLIGGEQLRSYRIRLRLATRTGGE
ncbi:ABC transporter permease [Paenibacillus xylaniclasticus]|uniref:ABC transporter permease n=1 Tax=Paenibacillus xylaniclasticus TaxID=588083 RepID=UPI000FD76210|nr:MULTISPECIES: ABC transporter permease [Paenibacillus]GFN31181.1 ABC transporter permease [Paenibacillus curdlanolyticus]